MKNGRGTRNEGRNMPGKLRRLFVYQRQLLGLRKKMDKWVDE